ncbi:MAG TPA: hypothetical protein VFL84_12510 [Gammaproteobacteria bacterium]|nr:hypothetical protein [Gammaproteobacteria bacterium]
MPRTIAPIAAALLVLCPPAFAAAQSEPAATTETAAPAAERVEEIVVEGRRTLFSLRRDVQAARENVWEVFSALNSDDDFDIACTSAPRTGSHVKNRACRPRYADNATRRAGQEVARRMSACGPSDSACLEAAMQMATGEAQAQLAIIPYMDRRLDDEFHRLAADQPELAAAILEYLAKEHEYEDAVRSRGN